MTAESAAVPAPPRRFLAFVAAQCISQLGSTLTTFSVGLWVLERTERLTDFAWAAIAAMVPVILLAPVNGLLIDRLPRRAVFLATQLGPACCALTALVLYSRGDFQVPHAIALNAVNGVFASLNAPAMSATTSLLVSRPGLVRANAILAASMSLPGLLAPALAGLMMSRWGMRGVLALDLSTFAIAVLLILNLRFAPGGAAPADQEVALRHALGGLKYLLHRRSLLRFLGAVSVLQLSGATLAVLAMPLLKSLASTDTLGVTLTLSSLGAFLGAGMLAARGGPSRRLGGVATYAALQGLFIVGIGLRPSMWMVAPCLFGANAAVAALSACAESILQERIPSLLHGRVFALRGMFLGVFGIALTALLGVLSDRVFEPLMRSESKLALVVGGVIGHGAGRGVAFLILIVGVTCVLLALFALNPAIAGVEQDTPPGTATRTEAVEST